MTIVQILLLCVIVVVLAMIALGVVVERAMRALECEHKMPYEDIVASCKDAPEVDREGH